MVAPPIPATHHDWRIKSPGDRFHFHPRATNPELWRTTVPLVVRERCRRHKGLIATWTAIHWLIVLHAASGRTDFGVREIAEEAGVGRNELTGPSGHIQRLVDLGLIHVVGHKTFRGFREPRPVYHIDLAELERLSLDLVPDILRDRQIDRPPPVVSDPRQLQLFGALPDTPDQQTVDPPCTAGLSHSAGTEHIRVINEAHAAVQGVPPSGTAMATTYADIAPLPPRSRIGMHGKRTGTPVSWPMPPARSHSVMPSSPETVPDRARQSHRPPEIVPDERRHGAVPARNRDVERENDRTNEGERQALTPNLLQDLVIQTTEAVLRAIQSSGQTYAPDISPALAALPQGPGGSEPLPAPVLALWQGDDPHVSRRDLHQLAMIAAEYNGPTGGHGAYWLGRAIVMADLCLGERGQQRSLAYLRRVMRRWRDEGSWGSDRDATETPARAAPEAPGRPRPTVPAREEMQHPAVAAYVEALHETPNAVQAQQIAETVADLAAWRQVLTDWQLNGWGERSVGKMLDRYQKSSVAAPGAGTPPSISAIHTHPRLGDDQRDRWIKKFHAAATPAEKRAVLERLEQEHPR